MKTANTVWAERMNHPVSGETGLRADVERAVDGMYPLHMPGHKRRVAPAEGLPYAWDVTEVPGTDDLHDASGILADAMARTARLFGAKRTWYLINGSTCGILAGIRALAPYGSTVVAARNCHKSVFHAAELGELDVRWITPPVEPEFGVFGSVPPQTVERALKEAPHARCVILTSPTYEGVVSDVAAIARICHARGVPLFVDEAHGAHLGLSPLFPGGALAAGADVVVQSAHKTLPSLTQTALLHIPEGSLADENEISRQLGIFETSSPSYPLMASLDGCTRLLEAHAAEWFAAWNERLARFYAAAKEFPAVRVFTGGDGVFLHDRGKLLLSAATAGLTGAQLAQYLRENGFELEMACGANALAMTSVCDAPDALDRLVGVLARLAPAAQPLPPMAAAACGAGERVCTVARALAMPCEDVPFEAAEGRVSAQYVWAYPPGVPLIVPGERVEEDFLRALHALKTSGARLIGEPHGLTNTIKCGILNEEIK